MLLLCFIYFRIQLFYLLKEETSDQVSSSINECFRHILLTLPQPFPYTFLPLKRIIFLNI